MSVLLGVAHGSKDPQSQQVVLDLLAQAVALRPGLRAEAAYIDNASPSVRDAIQRLVAEGARDLTVVPVLLGAASHSKSDLAASVQAARLAHPGVVLRYGRPLGPHPALVHVLAERLAEAGVVDLPVVLVAGGSLDPDANAGVAATARLLWEGRGFPSVDIAFVSATGPSVPQALERLRAEGHAKVALARYFLGPGYLPRQVAVRAATVEALETVVSEPLGAAPELSALLLERYDEARTGDIRMNCDACLYRISSPGLEASVGAPQVPHTHPDD
jgi:sirohydrochlorin cobaltochelatase